MTAGSAERTVKGSALCVLDELPYTGLGKFGAPFLGKFQVGGGERGAVFCGCIVGGISGGIRKCIRYTPRVLYVSVGNDVRYEFDGILCTLSERLVGWYRTHLSATVGGRR